MNKKQAKRRAELIEYLTAPEYDFFEVGEQTERRLCTVCGRTMDYEAETCSDICYTLWGIYCDDAGARLKWTGVEALPLPWILYHAKELLIKAGY